MAYSYGITRSLTTYDSSEYSTSEATSTTPSSPTLIEEDEDTGERIADTIDSEGTTSVTNQSGQLGSDDFMTLLLAQIKYQDPLDPMDNTESIAQMAQFSSLEEMEKLNTSMESMINMQKISNISAGAQFIGKNALVYTDDGYFAGEIKTAYQDEGELMLRLVNNDGDEYVAGLEELAIVEEPGVENSKIDQLIEYAESIAASEEEKAEEEEAEEA